MNNKSKLGKIVGIISVMVLFSNCAWCLDYLGSTSSVQAGPIYSETWPLGYHFFVGFNLETGGTVSIGYYGSLPIDNPDERWVKPGPSFDVLRLKALGDPNYFSLGDKLNWLDALEQGSMQAAFDGVRWAPGYEPNDMDYAKLARAVMSPNLNADAVPQDLPNMAAGGDPVLLTNGEYTLSATDLVLPGRVLSVGVTRSYGSRRAYNSRFGYGWDMNYNLKLRRLSDPNVIVLLDGQGSKHNYVRDTQDPQRYYRANNLSTYLQEAGNHLTLISKSGIRFHFDTHGNLDRIVDQNGNQLSFTYDTRGLLPIYGHNPSFPPPDLGGPPRKHGLIAMEYQLDTITDDLGHELHLGYDANGLLSEVTDFTDRSWTYRYDPNTNDLLAVTDPNGLQIRYTYDYQHNILDVIDPNGQAFTLNTYDSSDRVTHQVYGEGTYIFDYHPDANQTLVQDREGHMTHTVLNESGQVLSESVYTDDPDSDPNTYTVRYTYTDHQNVSRVVLPSGSCTDFIYDPLGNVTGIFWKTNPSDPNDADDPRVLATFYTYDPQHVFKVKTVKDPQGHTTTFDYDTNGNLIRTTLPIVGSETPVVQYTYNTYGQLDTTIAPDGIITQYHYYTDPADANNYGRLYQTVGDYGSDPNCVNITSTLAYDELGRMVTITDPNGDIEQLTYSELDQLIRTRDAYDHITEFGYNNNKKLAWTRRPIGDVDQVTSYTYDILDHVKTVTNPLGYVTHVGYTKNEDPNVTTDAEDNQIRSLYDERGLLTGVIDANDGVTEYRYNANGNLVELIDAKGNATTYTYDGFDRLISTVYADQTSEQLQYDKNSNIIVRTTRQGQTFTYEYDALNRLVRKTPPLEAPIEYTYDIVGRVIDVNDGTLQTQYSFDRIGRVTHVQDHAQRTVAYEYDQRGLRTKLTYPGGSDTGGKPPKPKKERERKRNRGGRQDEKPGNGEGYKKGEKDKEPEKARESKQDKKPEKSKESHKGGKGKGLEKGKESKQNDKPKKPKKDKKPKNPNSRWGGSQSVEEMSVLYSYDALGRVQCISTDSNEVLATYQYDDLSRRTQLTLGNGATVQYDYDLANQLRRLTNHINATETITFDYALYDRVGNRLTCQTDNNPTQEYLYDPLYQLIYVDYNDTAATRYYYDDLGNRTAVDDGTFTPYTSNILNQYTTVDSTNFSYDLNGNLTDTGQYKYTYDSENRLTDVNDQSGLPIASFQYDTQGRRIEKTVYGSPDQITRTLYDGDQVIAEYDDNDTLLRRFIYGPGIDEPICMIDVAGGNQVYYYHFDGLGSVVALSDVNNQIVERITYDVFGEPTIKDANGLQVSQSTIGNPYLFTGRRYDAETGLYYYRARYYAHDIGRFLQTDPIGYGDGVGWYGYCGNNPTGLVDPWGLCKGGGRWSKKLDIAQGALDVGGMWPGIGIVPDAANTVISGLRGNWGDMLFNAGAMIPALGQGSTAAKWAKRGVSHADEAAAGLKHIAKYGDKGASLTSKTTAIQKYYPDNNGFLGAAKRKFLMKGDKIDRYGGSDYSRFFSPAGTPSAARSLPAGSAQQRLRTFEVMKPFGVDSGTVAPAFGQSGLGIQHRTPVQLKTLLDRNIIREITP